MGFLKKLFGEEPSNEESYDEDVQEVDLEPTSEISEELKERIKKLLESGKDQKEIKKSLLGLGYSEKEVEKLITSLTKISKAEDLYSLSGQAFEHFLADLFTHLGYPSVKTKTTGDQGGDLVIKKGEDRIVVQAKNFSGNLVGNKAIQEVFTSKSYYDCNKAMVVTTSRFTRAAIELAEKNKIELWDKNKLTEIIDKTKFVWFPEEKHLRQGERLKISGISVENHPFAIKLRKIKQIGNVVSTNHMSGHQTKIGELVKVGFEIKNISDKDWAVGSQNAFLVDKSNKQHQAVKLGMEDDKEVYFVPYDYHEVYSGCSLRFNLLFHKKALLGGVKKFVINISYTTPEAYHGGTYETKNKIFKIEMSQ
ncbi:restriction endonuclease [Candidatus Woesearchaeota archaeon]|nr:restriction endonuclease [Candidatus Woesearchaeota archaeon]